MNEQEPLCRCAACGEPPVERPLRRGRCDRCYEAWVRARPVGVGACCASCDNRRRSQLRYFEVGWRSNTVGGRWLVLCHNCAASAERLSPQPRSIEALKMRLLRDRRWHDRRCTLLRPPKGFERRLAGRRQNLDDLVDLTDEVVVEMEADWEPVRADQLTDIGEVTGIHAKV